VLTNLFSLINFLDPVYFNQLKTQSPSEAFWYAYKAALAVNFITGMISTILCFFGPLILKYVPPGALLVPIAGIGIAFLGLEQITASIAAPIVGYYAIIFVFLGWYSNVRMPLGFCRMPEALQVILVGAALGWITGYNKASTVEDAKKLVKWWGPCWAAQDVFEGFDLVADYLGIVIPIAISATATTLMCLVSAQQAGDPFPVRESMLVGMCALPSSRINCNNLAFMILITFEFFL
jgi:adenine/guanine/hypoxanthine permease